MNDRPIQPAPSHESLVNKRLIADARESLKNSKGAEKDTDPLLAFAIFMAIVTIGIAASMMGT